VHHGWRNMLKNFIGSGIVVQQQCVNLEMIYQHPIYI
jgi:hypothetical protein